jgi:DNA polymerase-3 subunit delta
MTYTFVGNKGYIKKEISKISKKFNEENIVNYDLTETNIDSVIQDLDTTSLFGDKLFIAFNIDNLEETDFLDKYFDNPSNNTLILVSYKELDKRKKVTKLFQIKTKYKEFLEYDAERVIKDNLEDFKMSNMTIHLLINYCNNNINRIESELEKLKIYKIKEKEITKDDVELLVKKSLDSTIFNLIDAINVGTLDRIFKIYNNLLEEGETEEKIMYTIANHYRLLFQVREKLKDKKDSEIINEYRMHSYRFAKLKEQTKLISRDKNLQILKDLSDLDVGIKKGKIDVKTGMFLFFEKL